MPNRELGFAISIASWKSFSAGGGRLWEAKPDVPVLKRLPVSPGVGGTEMVDTAREVGSRSPKRSCDLDNCRSTVDSRWVLNASASLTWDIIYKQSINRGVVCSERSTYRCFHSVQNS